jgi:hypothetical protein
MRVGIHIVNGPIKSFREKYTKEIMAYFNKKVYRIYMVALSRAFSGDVKRNVFIIGCNSAIKRHDNSGPAFRVDCALLGGSQLKV